MKKLLNIIFISSCLLLFTQTLSAQGPGDPGEDPDIPIDGGISLLLVAGAAYGTKKIYEFRKK
jgi:hypothetical protein